MPEETTGKSRKQVWILILCISLVVVCAAAAAAVIWLANRESHPPKSTQPSTQVATQATDPTTLPTEPATEPTTVPTEPAVEKITSATVVSMGDILMHGPVRDTYITKFFPGTVVGEEFNYAPIFANIQEIISSADYAVINLETPLAGLDNGYPYSGVIGSFNAPDVILDYAKDAGFDMMLTANNHTYDCGSFGMHRTMEVILERELQYLGTQQSAEEPDHKVIDVNGIAIGMACYTYEVPNGQDVNRKSLNGKWVTASDNNLVSSFDAYWLELFYSQVAADIENMRADGAEAIVLYVHWGDEYKLVQNTAQHDMAQRLCDLGADVIIGGHPHVVQPVELLTSTQDPDHKTVCLYSMGNAVSAQRRHKMTMNTGHTEDGVIFSITFSKYSDGTVILEMADIIPTWVNDRYQILPAVIPAPPEEEEPESTQPEASEPATDPTTEPTEPVLDPKLQESYDRTIAVVGDGLAIVQEYLQSNTARVEAELGVK
ncbi:MAG: CapA family protein [Oscillospiraceae bacterium]|nr:CapA family protein [Oscillospiraceae bacterium]